MSNLENLRAKFDENFVAICDQLLPRLEGGRSPLSEAMRYSFFAPAKHLRPFLFFCVADAFTSDAVRFMPICVAIEFVHVYSLIHDDLPAIDDDDIRRGQPSCHRKFGEATAILAGDALLTQAFEILAKLDEDSVVKCDIIAMLASVIGCGGMIGGQMLDMMPIHHNSAGQLDIHQLHELKTAKFFAAVCEIGAIISRITIERRRALVNYGLNLGLAFQAKDDIADAGTDKADKNISHIMGRYEAAAYMELLGQKSFAELAAFPPDQVAALYDFIDYIMDV